METQLVINIPVSSKIHRSSWTRENKEVYTTNTSYKMENGNYDIIKKIIADKSGIDIDELESKLSIKDDMGLDKWELTEISQFLEEEFNITIDDDDVKEEGTLGQYVDLVIREINNS